MAATPEIPQAALSTRKQVAIQLGWMAVTWPVFYLLLPELPSLWAALLFAGLFGLLGVALPLVAARRRSRRKTEPTASALDSAA